MGSFLIRQYRESGYSVCFDRQNGTLIRIPMTGKEPYWNVSGPELLDISITNYCKRGCNFCYRASNPQGESISLALYERIIAQAERVGVMQVALGGGNPNHHPQFIEIIEATRAHHIIPSYTTNGQGMSNHIYNATKKHCGAIAVSWYEPYADAIEVIEQCYSRGIKVNIHFLLHQESIRMAIRLLQEGKMLLQKVNAIIFLNYKPICSSQALCLQDDASMVDFLRVVRGYKACKLGFDSCMISYLTKLEEEIVPETVDFCEAGRFSAFISEKGILYPCSFMNDMEGVGIDLQQATLKEGWQYGSSFQKMRERLSSPSSQRYPIVACKSCEQYTMCHGGCPLFPINRCRKEGETDALRKDMGF